MFSQAFVCPYGVVYLWIRGGVYTPSRHPQDGLCSGRYVSYWNAFLFDKIFTKNCMKMKEIGLRRGC